MLISIINPFVERLLVSASGLSTEISSLSTITSGLSTKISGLSASTSSVFLAGFYPASAQKSPISSGFFCRNSIYNAEKRNIPHISHISHVN